MITVTLFAVAATVLAVGIVRDRRRQASGPILAVGRHAVPDRADVERGLRIAAEDAELAGFRQRWITGPDRPEDPEAGRRVQVIPLIRPVAVEPVPDIDERTSEVLAADDLTGRDLAGVIEQVAPGAGSLGSFAVTVEDTRMRTSAELAELRAAEVAAYAAIEENEVRLLMAGFNHRLDRALQRLELTTGRADMWFHYLHECADVPCPRCKEAAREVSDEHKQIVSMHDTGELSLRELQAMLDADIEQNDTLYRALAAR